MAPCNDLGFSSTGNGSDPQRKTRADTLLRAGLDQGDDLVGLGAGAAPTRSQPWCSLGDRLAKLTK